MSDLENAGNEVKLIFSFLPGTWTYLIRSTNNMLVEITSSPLQANCCIQPSGNTFNHDIDSLRPRAELILRLIYVRFRQIPCKGRGQGKHLTSNMQAALHSRFMRFTGFHYGCWAPPLPPGQLLLAFGRRAALLRANPAARGRGQAGKL